MPGTAAPPMVSKSRMRRLFVVTALAATYVAWVFISRAVGTGRWTRRHAGSPAADAEFARLYGGSDVKILQFYAREGNIAEGDKSLICYGVLNAKSVRIEPHLDGVSPALNRCVEVSAARE